MLLTYPKEIGDPGKEASSRLLSWPSCLGKLLLELGYPALRGSECLLHDECALNENVRSGRLLRHFGADVFVGAGILLLGRSLL